MAEPGRRGSRDDAAGAPPAWPPYACPGCDLSPSLDAHATATLCRVHQQVYDQHWAPVGLTVLDAVWHSQHTLRLDTLVNSLAPNGFLPGLREHARTAVLRHCRRISMTHVAVDLTPEQTASQLAGDRIDPTVRYVASGTTGYPFCSAAAGLAWQLQDADPSVAAFFTGRYHPDEPGWCQPACEHEAQWLRSAVPKLARLSGVADATDWQELLATEKGASPSMAQVAAHVREEAVHVRSPHAIGCYDASGLAGAVGQAWHTALVAGRVVDVDEPLVPAAVQWRGAGFDPANVTAWLCDQDADEQLHRQPPFIRDPDRHAALHQAGFPDYAQAGPWLRVWAQDPAQTAQELHTAWKSGTPVDWHTSFRGHR